MLPFQELQDELVEQFRLLEVRKVVAVRKLGQASMRDPLVERVRRATQQRMVLAAHQQQRGRLQLGQSLVGGGSERLSELRPEIIRKRGASERAPDDCPAARQEHK